MLLAVPGWTAAQEKCLTCHEGIEKIADGQVMGKLSCTACHLGNADAVDKQQAHAGMYANPSDRRVASKTCGTCHEKDLDNAMKSLHATSAGKISGTRLLGCRSLRGERQGDCQGSQGASLLHRITTKIPVNQCLH